LLSRVREFPDASLPDPTLSPTGSSRSSGKCLASRLWVHTSSLFLPPSSCSRIDQPSSAPVETRRLVFDITCILKSFQQDLQQGRLSPCAFLVVCLSVGCELASLLQHLPQEEQPCSPFGANCSTVNDRRR